MSAGRRQERDHHVNVGFKSKWFKNTKGVRDMLTEQLVYGDLVEFQRGKYRHWAVYIGNGSKFEVVHLCSSLWFSSRFTFREGRDTNGKSVQIDDLYDVWADSTARINNSYDDKSHPFPSSEIHDRVSKCQHLDPSFDKYHLLKTNCEHFALWIRNGMAESLQVKRIWMRLLETAPKAFRDSMVTAVAASQLGGPSAAIFAGVISIVSSFFGSVITSPED